MGELSHITEEILRQRRILKETIQNVNREHLKAKYDQLTSVSRHIREKVLEVQNRYQAISNGIFEIIKERHLTIDELAIYLSEMNYPPLDTKIDTETLKDLNEKISKIDNPDEKLESLDQFIVTAYDEEHIDWNLEIWSEMECLKGRFHIIKEIVMAHKTGLYSLSTLAVFPQIEGVLAEVFPDYRNGAGKFDGKNQKKAFKSVLEINDDNFDNLWSSYYEKNILEGFTHLEPIYYLSRHAMAHGADKEYGTAVNSTKSLMIFDYIMNKVEYYLIKKDKEFKVDGHS